MKVRVIGRPGGTKHRARTRKRKQGHLLSCVLDGFVSIVQSARSSETLFGHFVDNCPLGTPPTIRHCGDLLPIPSVGARQESSYVPGAAEFTQAGGWRQFLVWRNVANSCIEDGNCSSTACAGQARAKMVNYGQACQ